MRNVICNDHVEAIYRNCAGFIKYERINPKRTRITEGNPLFSTYFTVLKGNIVACHNGFVLNAEPTEDFMLEQN